MKIRIKYFSDITEISPIEEGNMIDLRSAEDVVMKKGEFKLIPLGIAMELPDNYEALVFPRSSTFKKHHIIMANSIGVIDTSYNGDNDQWYFPAYATEDTEIAKDTRICQFRIYERQPKLEFEKVEMLGNNNRGGFGSTGTN